MVDAGMKTFCLRTFSRRAQRHIQRIRFRRGGDVDDRLRQREFERGRALLARTGSPALVARAHLSGFLAVTDDLAVLMADKLRMAFVIIEDYTLLNAPQRLARRLIGMAESYGQRMDEGGTRRVLAITQEELALMIGASRQTTNQILKEMAERIAASGDKVEDYIDVKLSVSESRYTNWPQTLQQQFAAARTVEEGKPTITLTLDGGAA